MKRKKWSKEKRKKLAYTIITLIVLAIFLFPIYWMVITSLKSSAEIFAKEPTFFPKKIDFGGYISQLKRGNTVPFETNLRNSLLIAVLTTVISTSLATLSAYGLARFRQKFNRATLLVVLITQMIPAVLFLSPLFIILQKMGLMNTLFAPVLYVCIFSIPFCIVTLRPFFLSIPRELEDAAAVDGCGKFGTFFRIMVPISYPGIITSAAFTFIWGWGDLMGALTFLQDDKLYPLTVNMYKSITEYGVDWSGLMAFSVILTIPVVLIFVLFQKYLVSGLTSGAVKG